MTQGSSDNKQTDSEEDAHNTKRDTPSYSVSPALPPNAAVASLPLSDENGLSMHGLTMSPELANRALAQYLLTDQEACELSTGAGSMASNSSVYSSDTGEEGDAEASDLETPSGTVRRIRAGSSRKRKQSIADPLQLSSGSITYDIYKWHRDRERTSHAEENLDTTEGTQLLHSRQKQGQVRQAARSRRHARTRSFSVVEAVASAGSEHEWDLPLSHAQITEPNGFRRDYMHRKAEDEGRNANVLTASFVEFLALYGHFAGGDFPSDEDDDDDDDEDEASQGYQSDEPASEEERLFVPTLRSYGAAGSSSRGLAGSITGGRGAGKVSRAMRVAQAMKAKAMAENEAEAEANARQAAVSSGKASVRKSFFLLIKSFIGSGVLFLPRAFYNGGLLFSGVCMLISACLSLYTMLLLIKCYEKIHCGYGEMGRRLYGKWVERAVLFSIVVSQIGFSCAGTIFVATNMRDLFNAVTNCSHRMSLSFWVVVQLVALVPLCLVRHIKGLSGVALLADVFIVAGLVYVLWADVSKISRLGMGYVRNFNPEDYSLFLGTAAYTFEGYALILPIVDSMRNPEKFSTVLSVVMAICATVAVSLGGLSYAAFGDKTEAIILLNMPSGTPLTLAVQLLYSLAMIFTMPLMMFPVIRILEQALFPRRSGKRNAAVKMQKNAFRILTLLVAVVVSIFGVEKLDRLVAIIGGGACVPIAFIYPPLFHLKALARTRWERFRDTLLTCLGMAVCVYVTYGAVSRWSVATPPYDFCDTMP
ncbi:hypothetical protein IW140_003499 [Coemansia sp. RSA 1813]|nr:hypothetical protein EV178_003412 [Coemansia sp. RSA 1646]KAJ1772916.1 hypothetical protein LPJ74_001055 [Coemansia sp. RSA 1843]KAJ2093491.1 hypothetical protein IW138_000342 [Coemansia sp. RSA 986]KAJ2214308.1 hypothetical protein EV179_003088 [Coemansia sp. RSA 487]KAJ2568875.1 hypothetical protein IW140_003499 [Coemansia sp. RSA 1813]